MRRCERRAQAFGREGGAVEKILNTETWYVYIHSYGPSVLDVAAAAVMTVRCLAGTPLLTTAALLEHSRSAVLCCGQTAAAAALYQLH